MPSICAEPQKQFKALLLILFFFLPSLFVQCRSRDAEKKKKLRNYTIDDKAEKCFRYGYHVHVSIKIF